MRQPEEIQGTLAAVVPPTTPLPSARSVPGRSASSIIVDKARADVHQNLSPRPEAPGLAHGKLSRDLRRSWYAPSSERRPKARRHLTRSWYAGYSPVHEDALPGVRPKAEACKAQRRLASRSWYAGFAAKTLSGSWDALCRSSYGVLPTQEVEGCRAEGDMPSLPSLVLRRANTADMGMATSSVTTIKTTKGSKQGDKVGKLPGMRLPLMRKESSTANLGVPEVRSAASPMLRPESSASLEKKSGSWISLGPGTLRKSVTAVGLSSLALDGRPVNRSRVCSRCSSLLSLASSSRYSLAAGSFVPAQAQQSSGRLLCKLCLVDVPLASVAKIEGCGCFYCKDCMRTYVEFEVNEGAYEISCPDAQCDRDGTLSLNEIAALVTPELMEKHHKFRLNRDVSIDRGRAWCPRAGCETICSIGIAGGGTVPIRPVHCPGCSTDFCSLCREPWHTGPCPERPLGIPFDSDRIKCCPMCSVPIEKDEGCAQMMCKRCKHVFCWYCLASLDDDFLLRHYDKGPCKNKLGHSRASVIWHRTQVIGIFAGFGLLLLVASPLLLLAAPCIVCCKCRVCGSSRLEQEESPPEDTVT